MSDSKCCGPPKPKRAKRQCHFGPNNILVLGEVPSWLYIQLKFGYIAIS